MNLYELCFQGHLHGRQMREANHRAAAQIFQRVNSSLLPNNILDLHGLHVDEALEHLAQVLKDKTTGSQQNATVCLIHILYLERTSILRYSHDKVEKYSS